MAKLTPYLFSEDARAQAAFYAEALGGEIVTVQTYNAIPNIPDEMKNKVIHLHMIAAGVPIFMSDQSGEALQHGKSISLSLEFDSEDEAHRAYDALSAGGVAKHPLKREFWGALFGDLTDKFGVNWMISGPSLAQG